MHLFAGRPWHLLSAADGAVVPEQWSLARAAATDPDPVVRLAFWTGIFVLSLSLLVLVQILLLRMLLVVREARRRELLARWRPVMVESLDGVPSAFPRLAGNDVPAVVGLWNHYQEMLRGEVRERLRELARAAGIRDGALRLTRQKRIRGRLLGIRALGHLGETDAWDEMWRLAKDEHSTLSLAAARAMAEIDPVKAVPLLAPLIAARTDWPAPRVGAMLRAAGPEAISEPLAGLVLGASPEDAPRLIRYLRWAHQEVAGQVARRLLLAAEGEAVIAACLQIVSDPRDRDLVRPYLSHPSCQVRVHAATAMGRTACPGDEQELTELLTDEEWWVRYRAAQALAALPFLDLDGLRRMHEEHPHQPARDVLRHVIAERQAV